MRSDVGANIPGYGQWLYIVAEDHAESDPRREEEKRFLRSITGSANIVAKGGLDGADPENPRAVADLLRKKRSALMGATAAKSPQAGTWKIGYLHVADILNGNADIRANLHIVSRVNFNQQFEAWRSQGETLDESLAKGLRTEAPKRAAKLARKVDDT